MIGSSIEFQAVTEALPGDRSIRYRFEDGTTSELPTMLARFLQRKDKIEFLGAATEILVRRSVDKRNSCMWIGDHNVVMVVRRALDAPHRLRTAVGEPMLPGDVWVFNPFARIAEVQGPVRNLAVRAVKGEVYEVSRTEPAGRIVKRNYHPQVLPYTLNSPSPGPLLP